MRYLTAHGEARSLSEIIITITAPDLPVEGIHFKLGTTEYMLGRYKVVPDALHLREGGWKPEGWSEVPQPQGPGKVASVSGLG